MLRDGLKAYTVRVNDVDGVAGFVLPGDRVDVALTRQVDKTVATTDVVLQNARVLAVDQVADERTDKPSVAKAVTLEVDVVGAQKLSLAATIGTLSLMLRKAGEANSEYTRRVSLRDLESATTPVAQERKSAETTTVTVTRSSVPQEYNVPIEANRSASGRRGAVSRELAEELRGRLGRSKMNTWKSVKTTPRWTGAAGPCCRCSRRR